MCVQKKIHQKKKHSSTDTWKILLSTVSSSHLWWTRQQLVGGKDDRRSPCVSVHCVLSPVCLRGLHGLDRQAAVHRRQDLPQPVPRRQQHRRHRLQPGLVPQLHQHAGLQRDPVHRADEAVPHHPQVHCTHVQHGCLDKRFMSRHTSSLFNSVIFHERGVVVVFLCVCIIMWTSKLIWYSVFLSLQRPRRRQRQRSHQPPGGQRPVGPLPVLQRCHERPGWSSARPGQSGVYTAHRVVVFTDFVGLSGLCQAPFIQITGSICILRNLI